MVEESMGKEIKFGNENYTIYRIEEKKNDYKLNVTGTSSQLPASEPTKKHLLLQMEQIRKAQFDFKEKTVNGMVGIGLQLNENLIDMPIEDLIKLEEEEYKNILDEINNLKLEPNDKFVSLDTEDYLIYKLEMEHDGLKVQPATPFTLEFHLKEVEKLREEAAEKENVEE